MKRYPLLIIFSDFSKVDYESINLVLKKMSFNLKDIEKIYFFNNQFWLREQKNNFLDKRYNISFVNYLFPFQRINFIYKINQFISFQFYKSLVFSNKKIAIICPLSLHTKINLFSQRIEDYVLICPTLKSKTDEEISETETFRSLAVRAREVVVFQKEIVKMFKVFNKNIFFIKKN